MNQKIIIACGCPAAGKSTYYRNMLIQYDYIYLSADAIRKELLGNEQDQSKGNLIFKTFYERLEKAVIDKKNIFVDNTNVTKRYRKDIIKRVKKHNNDYFIIGLVFQISFYKLLWRDLWRKKRVGYKVIKRFYDKFELPKESEGFHSIKYIED
jgi:predicted kinase